MLVFIEYILDYLSSVFKGVYIDSIVVFRLFMSRWVIIRDIRHYTHNPKPCTGFKLDIYWDLDLDILDYLDYLMTFYWTYFNFLQGILHIYTPKKILYRNSTLNICHNFYMLIFLSFF